MEWGCTAEHDNYTFDPKSCLWNTQVEYLEKPLHCQKSYLQQVPTMLPGPGDQFVQTTCFYFTNQLSWLVSDQDLFGNLDNFDVDVDNPFGKYVPPNGLLSTINLGQGYNSAYLHKVKDPAKGFMMPINFASDENRLQKGGKAPGLLFATLLI
jgi:hypothetical protein